MGGLKEGWLLQTLEEMENRVECLREYITLIKRCVKGKGVMELGLSLGRGKGMGDLKGFNEVGLSNGHGLRGLGPKVWRAKNRDSANISVSRFGSSSMAQICAPADQIPV